MNIWIHFLIFPHIVIMSGRLIILLKYKISFHKSAVCLFIFANLKTLQSADRLDSLAMH